MSFSQVGEFIAAIALVLANLVYCAGLDSISGADAAGVVSLFKAMAVVRDISLVYFE